MTDLITAEEMRSLAVKIHEPFAEFLAASPDEVAFELSLLDVVRFAGHACPAMVGAFLISRCAIENLFPDTGVCERGDVLIEVRRGPDEGATGPIANVFSYIFGAWEQTGFRGLGGEKFVRRNLLKFNSDRVPEGAYRFHRVSTGKTVDVYFDPSGAKVRMDSSLPFQVQWRTKITHMTRNPQEVLRAGE